MFEWTRAWIRLRREHSALRRGRLIDLVYDDNVYVFARQDTTETIIIAINRQDTEREVTVPAKSILTVLGTVSNVRSSGSQTTLELPANTAVAFKAL
jgi:glycosidase